MTSGISVINSFKHVKEPARIIKELYLYQHIKRASFYRKTDLHAFIALTPVVVNKNECPWRVIIYWTWSAFL